MSCVVEQDSDALFGIDGLQKGANARFGDDIQANRRLVQVEQFGIVQQSRRKVASHALPKRELAHRGVYELVQIKQFA